MVMKYSEIMQDGLELKEATGKWLSQEKIDGHNFKIVSRNVKGTRAIRLYNRQGKDKTAQFPEIVAGIKRMRTDLDFVLNGEIAYFDEKRGVFDLGAVSGRASSLTHKKILSKRIRFPCKLYVFDIIQYGEFYMTDNPSYTFEKRYSLLRQLLRNDGNGVVELLPTRTDLTQHFKDVSEADREGIVIKSVDNVYSESRTKSCMKVKNWNFSEIMFSEFTQNPAGILVTNTLGDRVQVSGKQAEEVRDLLIQGANPVLLIRHLRGRTEEGRLREGTYKQLVVN